MFQMKGSFSIDCGNVVGIIDNKQYVLHQYKSFHSDIIITLQQLISLSPFFSEICTMVFLYKLLPCHNRQ